jgi:branched-chain amino acid transport system ATP-binding protein
MNVLEVDGLEAGYGVLPVVRDLSLTVAPGEVVALLGPNGAGKTTTLLTIAGLLPPLSGTIELDGRAIGGLAPQRLSRLGIALVPEERGLFFDLTGRENLRLAPRNGRTMPAELVAMLPELGERLDRRVGVLSGGEQQMLAVGRAILSRPRLLLIDEMSLGLAPLVVERLLPVIRRVADEQQAGVLLVEQHVDLALEIADRIYVLNHGRLVLEGDSAEHRADRKLLESTYLGAGAL